MTDTLTHGQLGEALGSTGAEAPGNQGETGASS
jgi:hypothetical protein